MSIRATVFHLIARALNGDADELDDDYDLRPDIRAMGSDWFYELAMDLEADLGVEVPDDEVERWVTVGDVVRCMERLVESDKQSRKSRAPLTKRRATKR